MGLKLPSSNKPLPFPCLDSSASFRRFLANFSFYKIIFPVCNMGAKVMFLTNSMLADKRIHWCHNRYTG